MSDNKSGKDGGPDVGLAGILGAIVSAVGAVILIVTVVYVVSGICGRGFAGRLSDDHRLAGVPLMIGWTHKVVVFTHGARVLMSWAIACLAVIVACWLGYRYS